MSLSKNVMNMKFMQKALDRKEKTEEVKKLKDSSEWSLPTTHLIRKSLKPAVKVTTIGYGSINMVQEESEEKPEQEVQKPEKVVSKEEEASAFLKSIEKNQKKRKNGEGGEKNKKKKKKTDTKKVSKKLELAA